MTNKELREEIDRIESEMTKMKARAAKLKKMVTNERPFKPEDEQRYWFISAESEIYSTRWHKHTIDYNAHSIGNCFPTQQAAEDAVRVLKLIQKAKESQNGFVPDWDNSTQSKYSLAFYKGDIITEERYSLKTGSVFGYWGDKSACEKFVYENHPDLIWFFTEHHG